MSDPVVEMIIDRVAETGDVEAIKIMIDTIETGDRKAVKTMTMLDIKPISTLLHYIICNNKLEMVKYLHSGGIMFGKCAMSLAIKCGKLEIVEYLNDNDRKIYPKDFDHYIFLAITHIKLEILEYLCSFICTSSKHINMAIKNGNLEILEILYNNSASFTEKHINLAIMIGKLEVVKYILHQYDGKTDILEFFKYAIDFGKLEILKYLYSVNTIRDKNIKELIAYAIVSDRTQIANYLQFN